MRMHNPPHLGEALREDVLPAIKMNVAGLARCGWVKRVSCNICRARGVSALESSG